MVELAALSPPDSEHLGRQIVWLFLLAVPVACAARTIAFEEIFREPRDWCRNRSQACRRLIERKFFYVFTCEYCIAHWLTLVALVTFRYRLMYDDWRGYVAAFFAVVFVANTYLNLYARLRVDITQAKAEIKRVEQATEDAAADGKERS